VLRQRDLDFTSPKLAASARILNDAAEKLWYNSTMKLTIHVLKDQQDGSKQVRYLECYLWIGKNIGIRNVMDRLDILWTYLPLFLPLKGEVLKELSDR
jgi:hypothetical protein